MRQLERKNSQREGTGGGDGPGTVMNGDTECNMNMLPCTQAQNHQPYRSQGTARGPIIRDGEVQEAFFPGKLCKPLNAYTE